MLKYPVHSLSHATVGNAFYLRQNRIFVYFTSVFHRMKLVKARNTAQEYVILGGNRQESWIFRRGCSTLVADRRKRTLCWAKG